MVHNIVNALLNLFSGIVQTPLGQNISILIISMFPIVELRGGLIAASLLDLNPVTSFIICYIGNMLPIPLILWLITPIFNKLKKTKLFSKKIQKLEAKALKKRDKIEKYEFWGLLLFVGIPLPGTGGWTGALIASLIDMNKKKALLAIALGVLMAGIIMMIISYGILKTIIG